MFALHFATSRNLAFHFQGSDGDDKLASGEAKKAAQFGLHAPAESVGRSLLSFGAGCLNAFNFALI